MRFDENCEIFIKSLETQLLQLYTMQIYKQRTNLDHLVWMNVHRNTYYGTDSIGMLPCFGTEAQ